MPSQKQLSVAERLFKGHSSKDEPTPPHSSQLGPSHPPGVARGSSVILDTGLGGGEGLPLSLEALEEP